MRADNAPLPLSLPAKAKCCGHCHTDHKLLDEETNKRGSCTICSCSQFKGRSSGVC